MKAREKQKINRRERQRLADGMDPELVAQLKADELLRLANGERPYASPRK